MDGEFLVKVATALISIFGAVITYVLVPYYRSKIEAGKRENIEYWVTKAVYAAEKIYQEKGQGALKKKYVLAWLNDKGIDINDTTIDTLIEAAVKELDIIVAAATE